MPDSHLLSLSLIAFLPLCPTRSKNASLDHRDSELVEPSGRPSTRALKVNKEVIRLIMMVFDILLCEIVVVVVLSDAFVLAAICFSSHFIAGYLRERCVA